MSSQGPRPRQFSFDCRAANLRACCGPTRSSLVPSVEVASRCSTTRSLAWNFAASIFIGSIVPASASASSNDERVRKPLTLRKARLVVSSADPKPTARVSGKSSFVVVQPPAAVGCNTSARPRTLSSVASNSLSLLALTPFSASRGPGVHTRLGLSAHGLASIASRSSATTDPAAKVLPPATISSSSRTMTRPSTMAAISALDGIAALSPGAASLRRRLDIVSGSPIVG